MRQKTFPALLVVAIFSLGCAPATPSTTPATPPATEGTDATNTISSAAAIDLQLASWDEVLAAIAAQRGKIVVLDLWSNYCPPCMKELPGLVELNRDFGRQGVVCMTLNCNYSGVGDASDENDTVLAFLREIGAAMQNYVSRDVDQDLYRRIGIAAVPVVQVYGRDGALSKQFDNESDAYGSAGFTYRDHVTPYVQQLLAQ